MLFSLVNWHNVLYPILFINRIYSDKLFLVNIFYSLFIFLDYPPSVVFYSKLQTFVVNFSLSFASVTLQSTLLFIDYLVSVMPSLYSSLTSPCLHGCLFIINQMGFLFCSFRCFKGL